MTAALETELTFQEGGFYTHVDGSTLVITKLLATAVKFVRLGAKAKQKAKDVVAGKTTLAEEKLTLKQFRAAIVGVADIPLPQVGDCYRAPRDAFFDTYDLDAVRITSIDGNKVEYVQIEEYFDSERTRYSQKESLAKFVVEYSERVYVPARSLAIVAGGVYRDHAGAILRVLSLEKLGGRRPRADGDDCLLAVFTVNGGSYEYREAPCFLRLAIAATLDANALTDESLAEADYALQVSSALANLRTANDALAEAGEAKKTSAAALSAAQSAHRKALANLENLSKGQPMLPGVHAAIVASNGLAARHDDDDD